MQAYLKPPELDHLQIRLLVNRKVAAEWSLTDKKTHEETVQLAPDVFGADQTVVRFECSDALSPADVGDGGDVRQLSLALYELSLSPLSNQMSAR